MFQLIASRMNPTRLVSLLLAAALLLSGAAMIRTEQGETDLSLSAYESDTQARAMQMDIYYGVLEHRESIDVSKYSYSLTEFGKILKDLRNHHPDLYMIKSAYSYSYKTVDGTRYVTKYWPKYSMTAEEQAAAQLVWYETIQNIIAGVNPSWNNTQKSMYLHDYLAANYEYDLTYTNYDAYSLLTTGKGVCQAYALAYIALLEAVGITCNYTSSNAMNHAWNKVQLGGNYYNVDVTWDDPTADRLGYVSHEDFLVSDSMLGDDHSFTWEEGYGQCFDTGFDNWFWRDVNTAIIPMDGDFFYIKNGTIYKWDVESNSIKKCVSLSSKWYVKGKSGSYWRYKNSDGSWNTNFSVMQPTGNKILYNTAYSIKTFDPKTNKLAVICEYNGKGCIYGFRYNGSSITLQVSQDCGQTYDFVTVTNFKSF